MNLRLFHGLGVLLLLSLMALLFGKIVLLLVHGEQSSRFARGAMRCFLIDG